MGTTPTAGPRVDRLGERALLVRVDTQPRVHALADRLLADVGADRLEDVIPGDRSLLLVFDGTEVGERTVRRALARAVAGEAKGPLISSGRGPRERVIPVSYGDSDGPDLAEAAALAGVSPRELVDLHISRRHTVLFLGFAPGFPYLGDMAPLVVPRLDTPRTATPQGSVALAESYTGIYPTTLPGGWRVIGRTTVLLFDPAAEPPTYLLPGDTVRFEAVDAGDLPAEPHRPADWAG
jgi:KipI family sensor histidine kinase inhibitor